MLDVRYSHLYFYQSLNRLQRGLLAIAELLVVTDHPRNGVVYNARAVCLTVCLTITFESLGVRSSYSHIWYIPREYESSS